MLEIRLDIVEAMLVLNDVSSLGLSPDWRTGISTPQRRKEVGEGWAGALIIFVWTSLFIIGCVRRCQIIWLTRYRS